MFAFPVALLAAALFQFPTAVTVATDPLTDPSTEHAAAVGPVIGTNGFEFVAATQTGRYFGDGADAMAVSTSWDGLHWNQQFLPGITRATNPANPYDRVTFATVAYNARYRTWLISTLPIINLPNNNDQLVGPVVSLSHDGSNWSNPIMVANGAARPEKNWVTCDNNYRSSPYFGTCYVVWDDNDNNDQFHANVSTDGGNTWGPTQTAADGHSSFGADTLVQPNGTVVVTSEDGNGYDGQGYNIISFVSTNGGGSWSQAYEVSPIQSHTVAAGMRTQSNPTSGLGPDGTVYTVWQDCRFRSGCSSNDLVLSTSKNGTSWTSPQRIPLDSVTSGVDHFLPTLAVQPGFFGSTTLGLTYYFYPQANCTPSTCALYAAFSASNDGGQTWSSPHVTAGPMNVTWLAPTDAGYMVGDYFTATFPFFDMSPNVTATAPNGSKLNETAQLPLFLAGFAQAHGGHVNARHEGLLRAAPRSAFLPARLAPFVRRPHRRDPA